MSDTCFLDGTWLKSFQKIRIPQYTAAMSAFAWVVLAGLIPFSLGGVVAFAVPWRLRWVALLGLALAGAFWIASVLSSTPGESGYSDTPNSFWIIFAVLATTIGLALFCAGGWLGKVGRRAFLVFRRQ